jgi:hypothetical protein
MLVQKRYCTITLLHKSINGLDRDGDDDGIGCE